MCDLYEEVCFTPKNVYKWAKAGFAITSLSPKDSPWSRNTDSPIKKKF